MAWRDHVRWLAGTVIGLLALCIALIWVGNPYGNLPLSPLAHVIMDDNQRFQYPAVARSGRFDSIVVGTSTSRLLEPARLEEALGGRFANLGMNSATAWEQTRLARLFQDVSPRLHTLLVVADNVWCDPRAGVERVTPRGFPEWLYDASPWNDLPYMLNMRTVEIGLRRIGYALGLQAPRLPYDGYEVFVGDDSRYDPAKARKYLFGDHPPPRSPTYVATGPAGESGFTFPALDWLADLAASRDRWRRIVILLPPLHVRPWLTDKSAEPIQRRVRACKARLQEIARRHDVAAVDFNIVSDITTTDENYWDGLHYRVHIAARVVDGLGRALRTGLDDPAGDWRVIHMPWPSMPKP